MAETEGFEPPRVAKRLPVFKTGPFNRTWVSLQLYVLNNYSGGPYWIRTNGHPVMSREL